MATFTITEGAPAASVSASTVYDDLRRLIGRYLRYGETTTEWTTQQASDIEAALQSGVRQFYWPTVADSKLAHVWSFLRKTATVAVTASTGDCSLPGDFQAMLGPPAWSGGGRLAQIALNDILALRLSDATQGTPRYCAIAPAAFTGAIAPTQQLQLYPVPDADGAVVVAYKSDPGMVTAATPHPASGAMYAETLRLACLAAAESLLMDNEGVHTKRFQEKLLDAIRMDRAALGLPQPGVGRIATRDIEGDAE